jgi:hypothetical protein
VNVFRLFIIVISYVGLQACNSPTSVSEKVLSTTSQTALSSQRFAGGIKGVKIVTGIGAGGSFTAPTTVPVATPIPSGYPGYTGATTYIPGVKAAQFYALDGTTISRPSWLFDVQLGITGISSVNTCAAFGGNGDRDAQDFYRVSESDCSATTVGLGGNGDPVFARIILNRDATAIGSSENLMIQIEYQASSLHLNSDGISSDPEDNVDHLWKIFWNSTLGVSSLPNPFSVFVPPNYAACLDTGSGMDGPGSCNAANIAYRGSPVKVKQVIIPLSAYPTMSVIQLSRVKGRISSNVPYVQNFCGFSGNNPLCLGMVIRSITLMRM